MIAISGGADRQAAAGTKREVRLLNRRPRRSLQRLVGDFEGKDFLIRRFYDQ